MGHRDTQYAIEERLCYLNLVVFHNQDMALVLTRPYEVLTLMVASLHMKKFG
jgi:hypothetical protein